MGSAVGTRPCAPNKTIILELDLRKSLGLGAGLSARQTYRPRACDHGAEGRDVTLEGSSAGIGEPYPQPSAPVAQRSFDADVARVLQRGELFRERRVRETEPVTDKRKVDPVG